MRNNKDACERRTAALEHTAVSFGLQLAAAL